MELPSEPALRDLIQRCASLRARLAQEIGQRPMILPNASFFPDAYLADPESAQLLLLRMQAHAGMEDVPIQIRIIPIEPDAPASAQSCGSGGCGSAPTVAAFQRVEDLGNAWQINLAGAELTQPIPLTTELARCLALIFLVETQTAGVPLEGPLEVTTELMAVALGLGPLLLQGSHIYKKSCGGPQITQVTCLGLEELALAAALFATLSGVAPRIVARELPLTQREAFNEAATFVSSNPEISAALKSAPALLALGGFPLHQSRSWLSRWLAPTKSSSNVDGLAFDRVDRA